MDYDKDIYIDESALDLEWLDQAKLMRKYTGHLAYMQKLLDKLDEQMTVARAVLDKKIRKKPQKYGVEKLTEGALNAAILLQPKIMELSSKRIEAKFEVSTAKGAVQAVEHRKTSLENLVKLFGQQYFAGPNVPRDLTKEWEDKQKQLSSNAKVGAGLKRKKK